MAGSVEVGDALAYAVLVLGGLVLVRATLLAALALATRLPSHVAGHASAIARLLRPRLAQRVLATVVGLGVPVPVSAALAQPAGAAQLHEEVAPASSSTLVAPLPLPAALEAYVVRPGDTLWDIARRHLPSAATDRDVARAWPRWYAVNRTVIGPDPSFLRPGTRLRVPGRRPAGTPVHGHDRPSAARTDLGAVARSLDPDRR